MYSRMDSPIMQMDLALSTTSVSPIRTIRARHQRFVTRRPTRNTTMMPKITFFFMDMVSKKRLFIFIPIKQTIG